MSNSSRQSYDIISSILSDLFVNLLVLSELSAPYVHVTVEFVSEVTERQRHPRSVHKDHSWLVSFHVSDFSLDFTNAWNLIVLTKGLSNKFKNRGFSFSFQIKLQKVTVSKFIPREKEWDFLDLERNLRDQTLFRSVIDSSEFNEWELLGNFIEETGECSGNFISIEVNHDNPNIVRFFDQLLEVITVEIYRSGFDDFENSVCLK
jgi:hypothetical protein